MAQQDDDLRDRVRERFGQRSAHYRDSTVHASGDDLGLLVSLVAPRAGERALDVATGAGHAALALVRAGAWVTALDLTPAMLAETEASATSAGMTVETILGDAQELPFGDASFDIVTARMAPHHFPAPATFLAEVARVLRPRGRFGLVDQVAPEKAAAADAVNEYEAIRDASHNRQLSVGEWERLAREAGLDVRRAEVLDKWVDFDWWTSIQNVSDEDRVRISHLLADGPAGARAWYAPVLRDNGLIERFRIPHIALLAVKAGREAGRRAGV